MKYLLDTHIIIWFFTGNEQLSEKHALELVNLKRYENTPPHNDPFDKMMLCQAIVENIFFMTHDSRIAEYDTPNIYKV